MSHVIKNYNKDINLIFIYIADIYFSLKYFPWGSSSFSHKEIIFLKIKMDRQRKYLFENRPLHH